MHDWWRRSLLHSPVWVLSAQVPDMPIWQKGGGRSQESFKPSWGVGGVREGTKLLRIQAFLFESKPGEGGGGDFKL